MNKTELIDRVAVTNNLQKKTVGIAINSAIEVLRDALSNGDKVTIVGFGSLEVVDRPSRTCRNPKTGDAIKVPATKAVRFSVGKDLKEVVAQSSLL